jgi:hypothetical protein
VNVKWAYSQHSLKNVPSIERYVSHSNCKNSGAYPDNEVRIIFYEFWGSAVSIVSDYRQEVRAIGVRSPAEAKDILSSLGVQTGSVSHPASNPMGTGGGGAFPGAKRGLGVTLTTTPPSRAEVKNE